jgi:hypothetical protein
MAQGEHPDGQQAHRQGLIMEPRGVRQVPVGVPWHEGGEPLAHVGQDLAARLLSALLQGERGLLGDPARDERVVVAPQPPEIKWLQALELLVGQAGGGGDEHVRDVLRVPSPERAPLGSSDLPGSGDPPAVLRGRVRLRLGVVLADGGAELGLGEHAVEPGWHVDAAQLLDRGVPDAGGSPEASPEEALPGQLPGLLRRLHEAQRERGRGPIPGRGTLHHRGRRAVRARRGTECLRHHELSAAGLAGQVQSKRLQGSERLGVMLESRRGRREGLTAELVHPLEQKAATMASGR